MMSAAAAIVTSSCCRDSLIVCGRLAAFSRQVSFVKCCNGFSGLLFEFLQLNWTASEAFPFVVAPILVRNLVWAQNLFVRTVSSNTIRTESIMAPVLFGLIVSSATNKEIATVYAPAAVIVIAVFVNTIWAGREVAVSIGFVTSAAHQAVQ